MIEAVIFDRDGVIVDSEKIHVESVKRALEELGFAFEPNDFKIIVGTNPRDYKDALLEKYPVDWETFRKSQREIYSSLFSKKSAIKEIIALAKELKHKGFKLGVVTSSGRDATISILKMLEITELFDVIVGIEDCKTRKPSPEPYLTAANRLMVRPNKCLVFEDTLVGLKSAKAAGMKCIIVKTNTFLSEDFSTADLVLGLKETNFKRIAKLIEGN